MIETGWGNVQASFFDMNYENQIEDNAPLSVRMRPTTLDEFVGQTHIIGKGKMCIRDSQSTA